MVFKLFKNPEGMRNFVFGVEDSLVSTVGFISGVASAGVSKTTILISGIILVIVEGVSMGLGSLISTNSAQEVESHRLVSYKSVSLWATIMLLSYIITGLVVLVPYIFLEVMLAFKVSIALALVLLFVLGVITGKYAGTPPFRKGISIMIIGGIAITIGVLVGSFLHV